MRTIWKYPIVPAGIQHVTMPCGTKILSAGVQDGNIVVWAEVDPEQAVFPVIIYVVATGEHRHDDLEGKRFVATVQQGPFVWHIYASKEI